MLPSSRNPWTCDECATKKVQVANASATALKSETEPLPKQACEDKNVTVLFKSRDSILKIFTKEGFRCRSSGALASGLKWLKFDCISPGCNITFKCSETAHDTSPTYQKLTHVVPQNRLRITMSALGLCQMNVFKLFKNWLLLVPLIAKAFRSTCTARMVGTSVQISFI
jgi:hypothetical protein